MSELPSPAHAARWFDPRARSAGSLAFILNRLTGLGLTIYLALHLVVLGKLAQGPQAYDDFVAFSGSPLIKTAEVVLILGVLFHGLNGLRLTMHALGIGVRAQKTWFLAVMVITLLASLWFALHLFTV